MNYRMGVTDPEVLNRRLEPMEYISHPADICYFQDLVGKIRSMERPGDELRKLIPDPHEPRAWAKAYRLYQALLDRERIPADPRIAERHANAASIERTWNNALNERMQLLEYFRRGDLTEDAAQYIGLLPGDLHPLASTDPDETARYGGRRAGWQSVASRISMAIRQWEDMPKSERAAIPQIMAARRAEAATRELEKRVAAVETGGHLRL